MPELPEVQALVDFLAVVNLLDVRDEQVAGLLRERGLAAQDDVELPLSLPLGREDRQVVEHLPGLEVLAKALEDDDVGRDDEEVVGEIGVLLEAPVEVGPRDDECHHDGLAGSRRHLDGHAWEPLAGEILLDGVNIRDIRLCSLRSNIGIVQQDVFLFIGTIRENIAYGRPEATQEEIERAAKAARIHDFIMSLPYGYEEWVGERGVTLSGGQKQRLAIARTLLLDPRILIFDDSTSSVDSQTELLIRQALNELMEGRTTFVIAQRLRTVMRADEIVVLDRGTVVQRGRHEELITQPGLYRNIFDLELKDQEEALGRATPDVVERAADAPAGASAQEVQ